MNTNKANRTIDSRFVDDFRHINRELRAMKTRQLRGGENIVVSASNEVTDSANIGPAGFDDLHAFTVTLTPEVQRLGLASFSFSLYIGTDNDPDYLWPNGAELTLDQQASTHVSWYQDLVASNDTTGVKVFRVVVRNFSLSNAYTYYLHAKCHYPQSDQVLS